MNFLIFPFGPGEVFVMSRIDAQVELGVGVLMATALYPDTYTP